MEWNKVFSVFFILMALTTLVGYIVDQDIYALVIGISMNLIATTIKFGSRTTLGNELLAASLVADLHLLPAAMIHFIAPEREMLAIAMVMGAIVANVISVILVVCETVLDTVKQQKKTYW